MTLNAAGENTLPNLENITEPPLSPNFVESEDVPDDMDNEKKCRICGEVDVQGKELWVGCEKENPVCNYWVHVKCLGFCGMTDRMLKKIHWFCPKHAK
jgi:hypothetical protein